ncbi:hypothetical protein GF339_21115 [candidate division KSB3 bacterium]|uniref:Fibronectin type-III domain-containing protein n=1 Tax=candidate division KSB3 bacterium TaxID=2044937 RepID=A0A9D5K0F3_9BACT|nr:hypothetical protein [candidate division KSB3 bacterium]MBD3327101.1 hypothetical protein [candidate division KSB3 bacterium]
MKPMYSVALALLLCMGGITAGCGKKGDPIVPIVPQPQPIQDLSARIEDKTIVLSWTALSEYTDDTVLELEDIKTFTIYRKTEAPATNSWDFSDTTQGWTAAGRAFPIKQHRGVLRTQSNRRTLLVQSPEELDIPAENNRYIRLKLWANNYRPEGYIVFITEDDDKWDTDVDLRFEPAVHTSFYQFRTVFHPLKWKAFPLVSSPSGRANEYLVDMSTVPMWKGTISQIGVLLQKNTSDEDVAMELGLDSFELVNALGETATLYESPPWMFLADEEGWTRLSPTDERLFGATDGVLYAQGLEELLLLSQAGQQIPLDTPYQVRVRMKVTAGGEAYLFLRKDSEPPVDLASDQLPPEASLRIALQDPTDFHTYTVEIAPEELPAAAEESQLQDDGQTQAQAQEQEDEEAPEEEHDQEARILQQIGLRFPELEENRERHILIDYIDIVPLTADLPDRASLLTQQDIPAQAEIETRIREAMLSHAPEFDIPYVDLPTDRDTQGSTKPIKLAEINVEDPAPAIVDEEGELFFVDTGMHIIDEDEEQQASLEYGTRYSYQIQLTDRKNRKSERSSPVTIEFLSLPNAPSHMRAVPGDEEITLTWDRPILTVDGRKIRSLTGYGIFRSLEPGDAPVTPTARTAVDQTTFTDKNLINGTRYYYTVQALTPNIPNIGRPTAQETSEEVSAIPVDTIPPAVPTGVVGIYLQNAVNLYWNQAQIDDFAGFNVYRSSQPTDGFVKLTSQPILQPSYTDATAEADSRYYYRVTAIDDEQPPNESAPSDVAVVETFALE